MTKPLLAIVLLSLTTYAACKLGPFPDEPVEVPTAPEPDWGGVGQRDAGAQDGAPALDAAPPKAP